MINLSVLYIYFKVQRLKCQSCLAENIYYKTIKLNINFGFKMRIEKVILLLKLVKNHWLNLLFIISTNVTIPHPKYLYSIIQHRIEGQHYSLTFKFSVGSLSSIHKAQGLHYSFVASQSGPRMQCYYGFMVLEIPWLHYQCWGPPGSPLLVLGDFQECT